MKLSIKTTDIQKQEKSCVIVGIFEEGTLTKSAEKLDQISQHYLRHLIERGQFQGKLGRTLSLYHLPHTQFEHILLVGCGKSNMLSTSIFRKIMESAIKALSYSKINEATCYLTDLPLKGHSLASKIKHITEAAFDGIYRFDHFKSVKEPPLLLESLIIHIPDEREKNACEIALKQGLAIAEGVTLTKDLANMPSNICTPSYLADQAQTLTQSDKSLSLDVLDTKEMRALGMGALLGVAQGSKEPPKLICLRYQGVRKEQKPIALVGKGITFDTGGISLKPAESMLGMKYDMCGAASVMGVIKTAALLKLPHPVVGVIASAENMPGGGAYKPEDIVTSMSGQTIEVVNTDAEGRLVLSDALTYCERFNPDVVIDIATLTGAVVIALGFHATGLLANNQELADDLLRAGEESGDRAWQLPLWEEYQEQIKSPFADMANTGGRSAGTITAACFLSRFAKNFKWAHLDVAGTAAMMMGTQERVANGRPVPLLVQYLLNRMSALG